MIDFYEFNILSPFPLKTKDDLNSWRKGGRGRKENYSVRKCEPEKYFYPNSIFFDKCGNISMVSRHLLL
jgi:hypothetical protein